MKTKILVIENDIGLLKKYMSLFNKESDIHVKSASSGKEGLELLEKKKFDVVLAELLLEDLDGLSILREIRSRTPSTSFIIITSKPSSETTKEAFSYCEFDYLIEPFTAEYLLEKVRNIIKKRDENSSSEIVLSDKEKKRKIFQDLVKLTRFTEEDRSKHAWEILSKIASNPILKENLCFKGGGAINLIYSSKGRYVKELYFDFIGCLDKEGMLKKRVEISEALEGELSDICIVKKPPSKTRYIFDHFQAKFREQSFKSNVVKIGINYLNRVPILGTQIKLARFPADNTPPIEIKTYLLEELLGMKISSISNNCKPEDLYDIFISASGDVDMYLILRTSLLYYYLKTGKVTDFGKAKWRVNGITNVEIEKRMMKMLIKKTFISGDEIKNNVLSHIEKLADASKTLENLNTDEWFADASIKKRVSEHPGLKHEKFTNGLKQKGQA